MSLPMLATWALPCWRQLCVVMCLHHQAQVSRRVLGGATARRGGCARGLRHDSSSLPGTRAHLRDRLALLTQPPAMGSSLSTAQQPTAAYAVYASHTWVGVRRLCVAVALMALEPSARWHEAPPATMMCIRSAVHSVLQYHTAYGAARRMAVAVLAAIRAVTGPAGALLVVKNYTGASGPACAAGTARGRTALLGPGWSVVLPGCSSAAGSGHVAPL